MKEAATIAVKVLFLKDKDSEWWVGQCLEYDIAAQAKTLKDARLEFQRVFCGRIFMAEQLGIDPFQDIPPAPGKYHRMFQDERKTSRLKLEPEKAPATSFSSSCVLPSEAVLFA